MTEPSAVTGIASLPPLQDAPRGSAAADQVTELVQEAILEGSLAPGTRLNADGLAKRLGVSHIPVREALRALSADGWIEFRHNQGAFVRERSERELADLFEMRLLLEAHAASAGAERRTAEQIAQLERILALQNAAEDPLTFARLNAEFHITIAACSQNELLTGFIRSLGMRARFYFSAVAPKRREVSLREHAMLVAALSHRDGPLAAKVARDHIAGTRLDVLDTMRPT